MFCAFFLTLLGILIGFSCSMINLNYNSFWNSSVLYLYPGYVSFNNVHLFTQLLHYYNCKSLFTYASHVQNQTKINIMTVLVLLSVLKTKSWSWTCYRIYSLSLAEISLGLLHKILTCFLISWGNEVIFLYKTEV